MSTQVKMPRVHDLALAMVEHLKSTPDSAEKSAHIFRMICAVERAAVGVLNDVGLEQAQKDVDAASAFCQS